MSDIFNIPSEFNLKELTLKSLELAPAQYQGFHNIRKHYSNGLSKYIENIRVEIVTDLKKCKAIWNKFSPKKSLFDIWEFRYSFCKGYDIKPYFITIKNDSNILAVLPLCYDKDLNTYFWYGTDWPEDSKFHSVDPFYIPILLFLAPHPLCLSSLHQEEIDRVPKFISFVKDDSKYILPLDHFSSSENYLATLNKKKRYNQKRDRKHIELLKPEIKVNNFKDFEGMVNLSIKRFREKKGELSEFEKYPATTDIFKSIIKYGKSKYQIKMFSVYIKDRLAAADLIAIYNNTYYPLQGGSYNVHDYPGIGNYMDLLEIDDAIKMGMEKMDFLQIDYGWKHRKFTEIPMFKYEVL